MMTPEEQATFDSVVSKLRACVFVLEGAKVWATLREAREQLMQIDGEAYCQVCGGSGFDNDFETGRRVVCPMCGGKGSVPVTNDAAAIGEVLRG